jgi:hypothetical protein
MGRSRTTPPVTERVTDLSTEPPRHGASAQDASAREVWEHLAGPLSHATMRLLSLRSRFAGDSSEARELDEAIASIDRAFSAFMRTPTPAPIGGTQPAATPATPGAEDPSGRRSSADPDA